MAFTPFPTVSLLGFQAQGDIAGYTLYTSKRQQIVWFAKSPPKTPPTWRQLYYRGKFRTAATLWNNLTHDERSAWETATKKLSLKLNGVALHAAAVTTPISQAIATIENQTGLSLVN